MISGCSQMNVLIMHMFIILLINGYSGVLTFCKSIKINNKLIREFLECKMLLVLNVQFEDSKPAKYMQIMKRNTWIMISVSPVLLISTLPECMRETNPS